MTELGIEFIGGFGMPVVDYVELAAELGCHQVSIGLRQSDYDPAGYPRYSLRDDAALRREVKAALAANGVTAALGENLLVAPGTDMREDWKAHLAVFEELGITRANSVSFEPDFARNVDQYGEMADMAAQHGVSVLIEFVPIFGVADLPTAEAILDQLARPNMGLVMDTMHIARSGLSVEALSALAPERVGYIQLCDVPLKPEIEDYMYEAMFERRAPGDGDLPLAAYLAAMPRDRIVSLEVPLRSEAERGIGPRERFGRTVRQARELLATLD